MIRSLDEAKPVIWTRDEAVRQSIGVTLVYLLFIFLVFWALPDRAWIFRSQGFITLSLFGAWRYGWQLLHVIRMLIFKNRYYPKLSAAAAALPVKYPRRLYFVIPSYYEMPEITYKVFHSIMKECEPLPCESIVMAISVGSEDEIKIINNILLTKYKMPHVKLIFMIQKSGKRVAMGHALRAAAREFNRLEDFSEENVNDLVILMDGDTMLMPGVLEKCLPPFRLNPKLGIVSPNNIAMMSDPDCIFQSYFELKFIQRHHQFQSHSLSNKILTATGRFSVFRSTIVFNEEFIRYVESDYLEHWLFGRFRFLMGDDKSTWFYCLKEEYEMLYIPDGYIVAIEWRTQKFIKTSISLMTRWYGNMLRNNTRALMLGPKKMGFFIWWCILDQRLTTWTPLVGLVSALMLSVYKSPFFILFYLMGAIFIRLVLSWIYVLQGFKLKFEHIPLILYGQWIGPILKLITMFNLKKQSWSKGNQKTTIGERNTGIFFALQNTVRRMMIIINVCLMLLFCGYMTQTIFVPPLTKAQEEKTSMRTILDACDFGAVAEDDEPDDAAIKAAIEAAPANEPCTIRLPAGRLILEKPIVMNKPYITLEGSGKQATVMDVRFTKAQGRAAVLIQGQKGRRVGVLKEAAKAGDQLLFADIDPLAQKDVEAAHYLWLGTPNTDAFLKKLGSVHWNQAYPWVRQTIINVQNGKGTIWSPQALTLDLPAETEIFLPSLVQKVTLRNLEVVQMVPGFTPMDAIGNYENIAPDYAVDAVRLEWAADCRVEDVKITFAGRHPLATDNVYGAAFKRLYINGAWNKGKDGNGYVAFSRAYYCRMEDCEMANIRHLTFQWSASGNRVRNCRLETNVDFHGGFSHDNLVEGCTIVPPEWHPWGAVTRMPEGGGGWAPMDGEGNRVIN